VIVQEGLLMAVTPLRVVVIGGSWTNGAVWWHVDLLPDHDHANELGGHALRARVRAIVDDVRTSH